MVSSQPGVVGLGRGRGLQARSFTSSADQLRAQLAPGVVERLVDGVAGAAESVHECVERDLVEHERHEHAALALAQDFVDGAAQGGDQFAPVALALRVESGDRVGGPSPRCRAGRAACARSAA